MDDAREAVIRVWCDVLGLAPAECRPGDSFFELGGNSLAAADVVEEVNEMAESPLRLRTFFERPFLETLLAAVG
jgi:hypothetical protein